MPDYKLVSFDVCPFVQRSVITLEERDVRYEIEYIELADPPEWFTKLSPLNKVPILVINNDEVIFESAVINEFIDETAPGERMLPEAPLPRARDRARIEFTSALLVERNRMQHAPTEEEARQLAASIRAKLSWLEEQQGSGPFFHGSDFSLVDTAAAPLFQRLSWLLELAPDLGVLEGLPKTAAWSKSLLARESVQRSTVPDIQERYFAYLQGRRHRGGDREPSWLGRLAAERQRADT